VNRKQTIIALIPVLGGFLFLAWAAQGGSSPAAKERWLRVMTRELGLTPGTRHVFQPQPYQYVEVVLGAGEFTRVTPDSVIRRASPSGYSTGLRLDTSDDDFLIVATGGPDNLGKWKNRVVHYIPWDKIVDIYCEVSPVAGGVVR